MPLPGFEVSLVPPSAGEKPALRLGHGQQTLLLSAPDADVQAEWMDVLSRAARGEAPGGGGPAGSTGRASSGAEDAAHLT